MRSATAQRVGSFHGYITPFTNEMTISWQLNGQLFCLARSIAKVTLLSLSQPGRQLTVYADEMLTAFLELQAAIHR